eukprot:c5516_g1_i3.p1 GENE.c5516_g1_i3~~c5516_g1_i3.p1  ORF type:complete len:191 (+),score=60.87 c5516_g1_i3:31-573(+)
MDDERPVPFHDKATEFGGGLIPESMPGPETVLPQQPLPESFGPEWEKAKAQRETIAELKKAINDVSAHLRPAVDAKTANNNKELGNQLEALLEATEKLKQIATSITSQTLQRAVQATLEDTDSVEQMDKEALDNAMENARRRQQLCFGEMKHLLEEMKRHKKEWLAALGGNPSSSNDASS